MRNQDDEFNLRIILAGGKIRITSEICSTYYARSSLKKLWRQYFQYGFWRIRTFQKHGRPAVLRQIVPILFVLILAILFVAGLAVPALWWVLAGILVLYILGLLYGTFDVIRQAGFKYGLLAPLVFIIIHFGYGIGGLWGVVRFVIFRGAGMRKPAEMRLSR